MARTPSPFRIAIPQQDLDDLYERIERTRWPRPLPGARWSRGVPVDYLRKLADHWRTEFDWRRHEAALNRHPHYTTEIDGQTVHFIHARSSEPDALPLVLTHGWPSSVVEFTQILGPLSDPRGHGAPDAQAFHVVAPSLPGFGFSPFPEPPDPRPWTIDRVARTWAGLMRILGYERYGAHGNDAGALVTPRLALAAPESVVGAHITGGIGLPEGPEDIADLSEEERAELAWLETFSGGGSGYADYLARRPQTLGYGLHDSPVALLAYLVERLKEFDGWPEQGEEPAEPIDRSLLLANATLYWATQTACSSSWTYYEEEAGMPADQTAVPTGVSHGGSAAMRRIAERRNTIVHWADREAHSHMIAMSDPGPLVEDLREFFGRLR